MPQTLTGTGEEDSIPGLGGNDTLIGLAGPDVLNGGAGTDTASYTASAAGVTVSLATGTGSGGDAQGDTLSNIENLIGSNFNDVLEGNSGNNALVGGTGIDTVSYANATAGVTVSLAVTAAQNTGGAGRDTLSSLENLTGSTFNDVLTGSSGANVLMGLDGNDKLAGGGGVDTLTGGSGTDQFLFTALTDRILLNGSTSWSG
jgi:Ca2+-binding RTX toxin-like protein